MGDRANVCILTNPARSASEGVYLYTHSGGSHLPWRVQTALQRRLRWTDPPYLARIIFEQMIKDSLGSELGYGISTKIQDNGHPVIVVNPVTQIIGFAYENKVPELYVEWSFESYIALSEDEIEASYQRDYRVS